MNMSFFIQWEILSIAPLWPGALQGFQSKPYKYNLKVALYKYNKKKYVFGQ